MCIYFSRFRGNIDFLYCSLSLNNIKRHVAYKSLYILLKKKVLPQRNGKHQILVVSGKQAGVGWQMCNSHMCKHVMYSEAMWLSLSSVAPSRMCSLFNQSLPCDGIRTRWIEVTTNKGCSHDLGMCLMFTLVIGRKGRKTKEYKTGSNEHTKVYQKAFPFFKDFYSKAYFI